MDNRRGSILVVDDSKEWCEQLVEILKEGGYYVDYSCTIDQALILLEEKFYHLVILDIRMDESDQSNIDGMSLLQKLNERGLNDAIKVIMLSAYGTKELLRTAFKDYKVIDFLSKDEFLKQPLLNSVSRAFTEGVQINLALEIRWFQETRPKLVLPSSNIGEIRTDRETSLQVQVIAELEDLLCRLFFQANSVNVRLMTMNQSDTGMLLVQPFYTMGGVSSIVLKFGDFRKIEQEYYNFREYVQPFVGGRRNAAALHIRRTPHLGGIIYSLPSAESDLWEDLGSFYYHADQLQIRDVLNRLFLDTCGAWYDNPSLLQSYNLTEAYEQMFQFTLESLEHVLNEELKSVQGRQRLYFRSLDEERTFINPLSAMAGLTFEVPTYTCTTHGNFNQHNILVDSAGQSWLINFEDTNQSHILRDIAMLDSVVRFQLLTEATLNECLQMEEALCSIDRFSQVEQLASSFSTTNLALTKAYVTVVYLRTLASKLVERNPTNTLREYYIALLYNALNTLQFSSLSLRQREHALLCASLLVDRLGLVGQRERDISLIRASIGEKSFNNYQQLAEAIIRCMEATNPVLLETPYVENGTVWEVSLPNIGLRLRTQKAILLLRQREYGSLPNERLYGHITKSLIKEPDFIIIVDIMDIPNTPIHPGYRVVWFRPKSLVEMVSLPEKELQGWLGRYITTQVDVKPLLPYQTKGATELFFGRDYELMRLISGNLCRGIIIGAHRSGKTSLLQEIGERLMRRGLEVVGPITCTKSQEFQYFFERTLEPLNIDHFVGMTPESWSLALRNFSKAKQSKPIFLLDEVDNLLALDTKTGLTLGQHMRSLQSDGYCEFYLAGHARLREAIALEESPYRNLAEEIILTGLTESASIRLLQEPMKLIGFNINEAQSLRIFRGTAGVPVLIQEFCIRLLCGRFHFDGKPEIEDAEIEAIENSPAYLQEIIKHYQYGQSWISTSVMLITAIQKEVTRQVLMEGFSRFKVRISRDKLESALEFLVKFGVLEEFQLGHYRVLSHYLQEALLTSDPYSLLDARIKGRRKKKGN